MLHHLQRWGYENDSYIMYIVMFNRSCMSFFFLFFPFSFILVTDFISKSFFKKDCNKFKVFQEKHFYIAATYHLNQ